ncbi:MAG: DNA mismatch repair protein MutS [Clostridiales bacterium]|nr:DNA mismatch repair protein MutS [Clostridiales bacterium]
MEKYRSQQEELGKSIKNLESRSSTYSGARFIMFVVAVAALIVGIYDSRMVLLAVGLVAAAAFVALVFIHGKLSEELEYKRARAEVIRRYIERFGDGWKQFEENGSEYLEDQDLVARDMDLLGASSLYQFICTAGTEEGRRTLADSIKNPKSDIHEIERRQDAIRELASKEEFSMGFETLGVKTNMGKKKKYTTDEFVAYCNGDDHIPMIFNILRFVFPAITVIALILGIMGKINMGWTLVSFFVVLLFSWLFSGVAGQAVMPMISFGYVIEDYIRMFEMISREKFESSLLKDIQGRLSEDSGALGAIKKLRTISAAFNIRYNPIVHQILCGFTMWDFHLGAMMDRWKSRNGDKVEGWISAVSGMEELMSFAVLTRTRKVSYPQVGDQARVHVDARGMRHPLIAPDVVVENDAHFTGGATIITGSNMSGKTTFLRTLGINLVLAYAGAPVCADYMEADVMKIFTSMRVTDDVSNGISTFYAEILRIKTMVEYKKENRPMLCLIDEIFKGTNSADRIVGATQVIKKLSGSNSMTLVSTHDFELCDLKADDGTPAANYHFEEYYEGDQLKFDYKKKDGRCTTTNAMAILHMAGLD